MNPFRRVIPAELMEDANQFYDKDKYALDNLPFVHTRSLDAVHDLQDSQTLALRFEPLWNPIPLAAEKRVSQWIMPASIGLSIASILLSLINIVPSFGNEVFLLETAFPILLAFVLCLLLIRKVRLIHSVKPESSLTLLFLLLFLPVLTFGISSLSYSVWQGTVGTADLWVPILYVCLIALVLSSFRIRDYENVSVYLYQTSVKDLLSLWYKQDAPSWIKGDAYWVLRYMYYWPLEISPFPFLTQIGNALKSGSMPRPGNPNG